MKVLLVLLVGSLGTMLEILALSSGWQMYSWVICSLNILYGFKVVDNAWHLYLLWMSSCKASLQTVGIIWPNQIRAADEDLKIWPSLVIPWRPAGSKSTCLWGKTAATREAKVVRSLPPNHNMVGKLCPAWKMKSFPKFLALKLGETLIYPGIPA